MFEHSTQNQVNCSTVACALEVWFALGPASGSGTNGSNGSEYSGEWGSVCDDAFQEWEAAVACKSVRLEQGLPARLGFGA